MSKIGVKINKPVYLGLSTLDMSKTVMCEFWYDYIKPNYGDKAKLGCTDKNSFTFHVKSKEADAEFAGNFESRFNASNYIVKKPLPKEKIVFRLTRDEFV